MLDVAGERQHSIREAALNEMNLDVSGYVMTAGHLVGGGVGESSSGIVRGDKIVDSELSQCKRTHTFRISAGEAFRSKASKRTLGHKQQ